MPDFTYTISDELWRQFVEPDRIDIEAIGLSDQSLATIEAINQEIGPPHFYRASHLISYYDEAGLRETLNFPDADVEIVKTLTRRLGFELDDPPESLTIAWAVQHKIYESVTDVLFDHDKWSPRAYGVEDDDAAGPEWNRYLDEAHYRTILIAAVAIDATPGFAEWQAAQDRKMPRLPGMDEPED